MLQGELDEHLGYEKHSKEGDNSGNSRNGSYPKKVKTESLGDMILNIPRDRKSDFEPQLIPKGQRMSDKLKYFQLRWLSGKIILRISIKDCVYRLDDYGERLN